MQVMTGMGEGRCEILLNNNEFVCIFVKTEFRSEVKYKQSLCLSLISALKKPEGLGIKNHVT